MSQLSVSSTGSDRSVSSIVLADSKVEIKSPTVETALGQVIDTLLSHPLNKQLSKSNLVQLAYEGVKILKTQNIEGLASDDNKNIVLSCLSQCITNSSLTPTEKLLLSEVVQDTIPHAIDLFVDALDTTITKIKTSCFRCCSARKKPV